MTSASDTPARLPIRRALLSVWDKAGLLPLAEALRDVGAELVSTGGTARALREAGHAVTDVSEITGFPEMMDGRVKTLHPAVHGGLLARRDLAAHMEALEAQGFAAIDCLVVNLYPFEETLASGADRAACVEMIDIGGPAMIRAASKNHDGVAVVTDPADYETIVAALPEGTDLAMRRRLAAKAFATTAAYDAAIAAWMQGEDGPLPERLTVSATRAQTMRYGENPHQAASLYLTGETRPGAATARSVQGKALSYNNVADADAAFELVSEFGDGRAAVAIIKHANPCGVAVAYSLSEAHARALACDPVSAFGGIVATNRALDRRAAEAIVKVFTEVVIAPGADEEALAVFAGKKNLRLLLTEGLADPSAPGLTLKPVASGLLAQARDAGRLADAEMRIVTTRAPSEAEMRDLAFAWTVAKHVKSNAIVYAKDGATVGIGAGQMSRLDSTRIAARKAEDAAEAMGADAPLTRGSVFASDAFFPFADGLLAGAAAGATAVIQPGGSMRDEEVIAAADEAGLAMVFTGMRHFRH
ncbi:MAG: bifunctional phosphoribosylaminoimidazolecarboxamide formyltransferase/IMP cyclohydrolase [Pseudomonadota bacterium]